MDTKTKECKHCQETKSIDDFHYRVNRNTYGTNCRACDAEKARERRKNKDVQEKVKQSQKKYYEKNKEELNKISRDYHEQNKDRTREQQRQYYKNNSDKLIKKAENNRERVKELVLSGQLKKPNIKEKKCTKCGKTQDISEFSFRKIRNVYESACKTCNTNRERVRRSIHSAKINARRKVIRKPLTAEQKLTNNLRKRVNGFIENRNGKNLYLKLLGCDKQFLMKWFEYNFELDDTLDMNWNNYGNHWQKPDNLSKGAKIKPLNQIRQEIRVKNFLKEKDLDKNIYKYSIKYEKLV
jgi:hypothetical protein